MPKKKISRKIATHAGFILCTCHCQGPSSLPGCSQKTNNSMSGSYSPLAVASRRRIKPPTQLLAFVGRKRISSNARRLLTSIACSPKAKKKTLTCEAEIPVIFYPDEDSLPYKGMKNKNSFVDPFAFEAKVHDAEEKKNSASSSTVSFEIKGTIRCVPALATIIENEQQEKDEASIERGRENCGLIISPTSIKDDVDTSDCTYDLAPVRLFQDDVFDSNEFTESGCGDDVDEAISFLDEAISFLAEGVSSLNIIDASDEETESLEDWVDSASLRDGFTKAEGFQSHEWIDNTE